MKIIRDKPLILVIDDSAPIRDVLKAGLHKLGDFDVVDAADGPSGLFAAVEHEPDLILLDWVMPRMTGLEVLQELRNRHETRKTPIFMLTKRDMMSDVMDATDAGADGYFTKPLKLSELTERLKLSLSK